GTLLSSQGTDASFVLTRSNTYWGFPPGFRSSFLRFRLYQSLSRFAFRGFRFRAFPFPAAPTISGLFPFSATRPLRLTARDRELRS
ncbi:hypothetical protein ACIO7M_33000, partial [Streptomyces toxytricini]